MKQLRSHPLVLLLVGVSNFFLAEGNKVNHGEKLIRWLRDNGGFVNENIEIRRADPNEDTSRFGMFTSGDLKMKDVLLVIPRECLITSESGTEPDDDDYDNDDDDYEDDQNQMNCKTVKNLIDEMKLGNESRYAPYVNYLLDSEAWGHLPSSWSNEGKVLLRHLLESNTNDEISVPPYEPFDWDGAWEELCGGGNDVFDIHASLVVIQRSWDDILIPVYDMMSHRNGKWLNTESSGIHEETDIVVRAKRDIQASEEIYTSYNMCEDCGNRAETYGTPEIFRDYGFIEQFPQRWIFADEGGFEIDETDTVSRNLSLSWISNEWPSMSNIKFLQQLQGTMKKFDNTLTEQSQSIPSNEMSTLNQYYESLTLAVNLALETALKDDTACPATEKTCVVSSSRYDDLEEDHKVNYSTLVCGNMDENLQMEDYDLMEEVESLYQSMTFKYNPTTKDTCFFLDGICQICTSYRPHYHEMSVHYAARYLPKIERALFVGGGDSMLLYELLQYPSIDLIVGLELDQTVPRKSFKHFGTQPHFDNEKVNWWFGDATKSLLMLPKEYFGSFDLVLVDLSETVMSFTVTKELDVFEVLSLLLKPDGIMLKNELYFETMANTFEHTLQYWYYDVPIICSQSMVIASNGVNFALQPVLTEHNVSNLLIGPLQYDDHFELYHDFARNADNKGKFCKIENDELEKIPLRQTNSPGMIMILEAEGTHVTMKSVEDNKSFVRKILSKEGFNIISTVVPGPDYEGNVIVTVMEEGYVISRFWEDYNYYGFDIHLWSSFGKQDNLKKALVLATGCATSSQFRVVAGGMFGLKTWKDDLEGRGPRRTHSCESPGNMIPENSLDSDTMQIILEEKMKFSRTGSVVLVICGSKQSQSCRAYEVLKQIDSLGKILDVWMCPDVNEFSEDAATQMYACEQALSESIRKRLDIGEKLDAIIFDAGAPFQMAQIFTRIFDSWKNMVELLAESPKVTAISRGERETWRINFINRFRTDIFELEPVFKIDTLIQDSETNIYVHTVVNDERAVAVKNLRLELSRIEKRAGIRASVEGFMGGGPHYEEYYIPTRTYSPDDYDKISQSEQWSSQEPLEFQTIFQLELENSKSPLSEKSVKVALEQTILLSQSSDTTLIDVHMFTNIGDGCLAIALWNEARAVVVWDGRKHIDINLTIEDEDDDYSALFEKNFLKQLPSLKTMLRDEQPRGYGRVVNFLEDIDEYKEDPLWA